MLHSLTALGLLACGRVLAGDVLWDGRFNDMTSSTDLLHWSWGSEVGDWQYYIHGSEPVTDYVNLSPSFKNPADKASAQGVKITIDHTSFWAGQTMRRTELIPQTTAPINSGHVYYHFSMMHTNVNAPSIDMLHKVNFFEGGFSMMSYGSMDGESSALQWVTHSSTLHTMEWPAGLWVNVAYDLDFTAGTCGLYISTGGDDLVLAVEPVECNAKSNGEDWHMGVLRLPRDGYTDSDVEDWHFSGVYVESGLITTSVTGPGGSSSLNVSDPSPPSGTCSSMP